MMNESNWNGIKNNQANDCLNQPTKSWHYPLLRNHHKHYQGAARSGKIRTLIQRLNYCADGHHPFWSERAVADRQRMAGLSGLRWPTYAHDAGHRQSRLNPLNWRSRQRAP